MQRGLQRLAFSTPNELHTCTLLDDAIVNLTHPRYTCPEIFGKRGRYRDYKYEFRKGHVDTPPVADGRRTFYMSYPKEQPVDLSLFDSIEEQYAILETAYVIGTISLARLEWSSVWKQKDVSLIAFE